MTSATDFPGNDGLAISATGIEATRPMGAKSLRGSIAGVNVKAGIDRNGAGMAEQQRVAVGRGMGDRAAADGAAGAGLVVHDHLLMKRIRQLGGDHARHRVHPAARRIGHHQRNDAIGIACGRGAAGGRQHADQRRERACGDLSERAHEFPPDTGREPATLDAGTIVQSGGLIYGRSSTERLEGGALKVWGAFDRYRQSRRTPCAVMDIGSLSNSSLRLMGLPVSALRVAAGSDPDHQPVHLKGDQP